MKTIVKAIAGSHLFGTNTATSDTDYKGVYIPKAKDILLGTAKPSLNIKTNNSNQKNTKDDVDIEFYSLYKFMQMLREGQTVALELLWTPEDKIIETSDVWKFLQKHRNELLHKKVTSFVGYCKTQADKYGVKGSRMAAIKKAINAIEDLKEFHNGDTKLRDLWYEIQNLLAGVEHIEFGFNEHGGMKIHHLTVCSKQYQEHASLDYVKKALSHTYDAYGARAKQAENNEGIDWKALSHAYRVCCQAIEILSSHELSLPLRDLDRLFIRKIKAGEIPFSDFQPKLEAKLQQVLAWESLSTLPVDIDWNKWEETVLRIYANEVGLTYDKTRSIH